MPPQKCDQAFVADGSGGGAREDGGGGRTRTMDHTAGALS